MKNKVLLLLICMFAATKSFSQDKGYVAISLGPSFPVGDLASKDTNNESAGLADTGAIFDISFVYKFGKYLGVSALLRGQANPVDSDVLVNEIASQSSSNVNYDIDPGNWGIGSVLVGGYGSFPMSKKFSFESRAMVGYASASSPEVNINLSNGFNTGWVTQESKNESAFAYLFAVGVKFNAGRRICVLANVDYFGAKAKFENVEVRGSNGTVDFTSFEQPFQTINLSFGLGYRL